MLMLDGIEPVLRLLFAVAAAIYVALGIRTLRSVPEFANGVVAWLLLLIGVLLAGTALSYATSSPPVAEVGRVLSVFASGFLAVAFYVVYREYTVGPAKPAVVALLSIVPLATVVLAVTNPMHGMIWAQAATAAGSNIYEVTEQLWFSRVHAPYLYGLIAYALMGMGMRLPTIAPAHRGTVMILIASGLVPLTVSVGNLVWGIAPPGVPLTSLSLVLMLPLFGYTVLNLKFHEFSPFAYRTLFNHVRDPVIGIDAEQRIVCANNSAQALLGASERELVGQHLWKDFEQARKILKQAKDLDLTQTLRLDNDVVYELSVQPLTGRKGQNVGMVVVCRDVTERRIAQIKLAESEQLIRTLIETSSNGILRFTRNGENEEERFRCLFANKAAEAFLGGAAGTLVGAPLVELATLQPDRLIQHFDQAGGPGSAISFETAIDRGREERWLRIVGEPVGDDFSVTLIDITQRKRNENKMLADALRDPLTGVLNRRGFEQEAARSVMGSDRGAVLYLDLNHFKTINDRFGHQVGDALLKAFGHRLEFCLRPEDTLGRLGGDEFAIVLPGVTIQDAQHIAIRLVETAQKAYIIQGKEIECSASVGIAIMPRHGSELWHLVSVADEAMYNAKALDRTEAANDPVAYIEAATAS
jgi:diguanylate cyclase (GGDEF)-like protein/PAS domain S-box-containing protein